MLLYVEPQDCIFFCFLLFFLRKKCYREQEHDAGVMKDLRCWLYTMCSQCASQDWRSACSSGQGHVTNQRFLPKPKHASSTPGDTRSQLRRLLVLSEPAALELVSVEMTEFTATAWLNRIRHQSRTGPCSLGSITNINSLWLLVLLVPAGKMCVWMTWRFGS